MWDFSGSDHDKKLEELVEALLDHSQDAEEGGADWPSLGDLALKDIMSTRPR